MLSWKVINIAFVCVAGALVLSAVLYELNRYHVCDSEECEAAASILRDSLNQSINPCEDFYEFACGGWTNSHTNYLLGRWMDFNTVQMRRDENFRNLTNFLRKSNTADEPKSVHKARKLFSMCLDKKSYRGAEKVYGMLKEIGVQVMALASPPNEKFDYVIAMAKAARLAGIQPFFNVFVRKDIRDGVKNVIWIAKPILENEGFKFFDEDVFSGKPSQIYEYRLMQAIRGMICFREYRDVCPRWVYNLEGEIIERHIRRLWVINKVRYYKDVSSRIVVLSLQDLQNITDNIGKSLSTSMPKLDWRRFMEELFRDVGNVTFDQNTTLILEQHDFIREMITFVYKMNLRQMELLIWWNTISALLPYTNGHLLNEKLLADFPLTNREEKCVDIVFLSFGASINYFHVTKKNYKETKTKVSKLFESIRNTFKTFMEEVSWMDEKTKEKSIKKLMSLKAFITHPEIVEYPEELDRLYADMKIDDKDDFIDVVLKAHKLRVHQKLSKLIRANDTNECELQLFPANVVKAFYIRSCNALYVPFASLGLPFYFSSINALNYGTVGTALGGEISHGFDEHGRYFNETGNMESIWSQSSIEKFHDQMKCFEEIQYDQLEFSGGTINKTRNTTLTSNENLADSGGFKKALYAYRQYVRDNGRDSFLVTLQQYSHEQLFTLAFANSWCEYRLDPVLRNDGNKIRVNNVLMKSKEFAKIWDCDEKTPMNVKKKCSLW